LILNPHKGLSHIFLYFQELAQTQPSSINVHNLFVMMSAQPANMEVLIFIIVLHATTLVRHAQLLDQMPVTFVIRSKRED